MTATNAPEALLKRLREGSRFLLSTHINPDGDAIGSAIGTARILKALGIGAVIWNRDETPGIYRRLAGSDRIHSGPEPPGGFPDSFDAVIALECPSLDRTGLAERLGELPILNIDHHLGNEHYGEINWVDPSAPSLGEMIFRLAKGFKLNLDQDTATALYLTLVTDTGGFRFANATPKAFETAGALVTEGARPEQVAEWLYESQPASALRLTGEMLQTLRLDHDGRVATAFVTREMFDRAQAEPSDTEGLIDQPRSIAGVAAVAMLRQLEDGSYKVSLRSRGDIDVEAIARRHGGGGHRNAAGYPVQGGGEETREAVVAELGAALPSEPTED